MNRFTEISPVGVKCGQCGVMIPKTEMKLHRCDPDSIFRFAQQEYEMEDIRKNAGKMLDDMKGVTLEDYRDLFNRIYEPFIKIANEMTALEQRRKND